MTTTGYARSDGVATFFEVHGTGDPLVLLHGGLLTTPLTWEALLPCLAASRQVVAIELQGHGHTADTGRELTLANLAGDVVAVLDHLGLRRADLFGFSLGAMVATETAVAHPGRVDRLVLASVPFRPEGYVDLGAFPERMPTADDVALMQRAYADVAPDPAHFDAFAEKANVMVGGFAGWPVEQLAAITAPTLVLVGDTDFVTVEHAAWMAATVPGAGLAVLPHATHMDVPRRADVVAPLVEEFLRR